LPTDSPTRVGRCQREGPIVGIAKQTLINTAKDAQLMAPEALEIRFSKGANEASVLTGLVDKVKRFAGKEPKLVDVSADYDPETYEIWFSKR
jgi:hypothetical protein